MATCGTSTFWLTQIVSKAMFWGENLGVKGPQRPWSGQRFLACPGYGEEERCQYTRTQTQTCVLRPLLRTGLRDSLQLRASKGLPQLLSHCHSLLGPEPVTGKTVFQGSLISAWRGAPLPGLHWDWTLATWSLVVLPINFCTLLSLFWLLESATLLISSRNGTQACWIWGSSSHCLHGCPLRGEDWNEVTEK